MKRSLLIALVTLSAFTPTVQYVSAQNDILFDDPANHSYFGVRAGLDISSPSPNIFKNGGGFHAGVVFNMKLVKNLYIEPGADLYYNTWSLHPKDLEPAFAPQPLSPELANLNSSFRNFGIRIPLMVGYHFDFTPTVNVAIFTGPELSIGLRNRFKYSTTTYIDDDRQAVCGEINCYSPGVYETGDSQIDKFLYYVQDLFKRVDCAWKAGIGVNYDNFHFSVGGAIGMGNVYKHRNASAFSDDVFRMNRLTVTVGYNF